MKKTILRLACAVLVTAFMGVSGSAQETATSPGYKGLGAQSVSPETVAKYAPRPLDPAISRHIQNMFDIRSPGSGLLSPDGKRLYFTWNVTGISQVWRIDTPKGFPVQMTGGEDSTSLDDITPDGKWLVISRDRKGEENPGLYLQSADGGPLVEIQHKPDVQTFASLVTPDSRSLFFEANDVAPDSYAIYRHDLQSGARETVWTEPGLWILADRLPDGRLLLRKETGSIWAEYSILNPATKKLEPLFGQNEHEDYAASFGHHPGEVLVLTPKFGEFRRLYRFQDGKFTPITPELHWDVEGFTIDEARTRILYQVNDGGFSRLYALDADTLQPVKTPDFAGADSIEAGSTTRDGRVTMFLVESAEAPMTSWAYDWQTGRLTQWVLPSAPEIDLKRFAKVSIESYPARDGTPIPMLVCRPTHPCDGPCPVIVSFHGGPEGQSRPGFSPNRQIFVDAGFIYVAPNVRGSEGYGKTWLNADNGPKRLDIITDIEDCAKYIRANWGKDGKAPKIGIMGGSYGGYSALIGMTMFAGDYDAGVSIVGIGNFDTFLRNTAPYRRLLRITEYGDPDKDAEALRKLSPITYLNRVKAPLMLIQGVSDPRVPVGEALQIHDALATRNIPVELILFADEGHGAQQRENRVYQTGHALRFFKEHLQGEKSGS